MKNLFLVRPNNNWAPYLFCSVATALAGSSHDTHAMVLDCILADIKKDSNGKAMTDQNGDYLLENHIFKFKNTYRNYKAVEIRAGFLTTIEPF